MSERAVSTHARTTHSQVVSPFRVAGKYMQMMNILKPIAFDVIHCVSQLFDYYLYAVYTFFGRNDMVWRRSPLLFRSRVTHGSVQPRSVQIIQAPRSALKRGRSPLKSAESRFNCFKLNLFLHSPHPHTLSFCSLTWLNIIIEC